MCNPSLSFQAMDFSESVAKLGLHPKIRPFVEELMQKSSDEFFRAVTVEKACCGSRIHSMNDRFTVDYFATCARA